MGRTDAPAQAQSVQPGNLLAREAVFAEAQLVHPATQWGILGIVGGHVAMTVPALKIFQLLESFFKRGRERSEVSPEFFQSPSAFGAEFARRESSSLLGEPAPKRPVLRRAAR